MFFNFKNTAEINIEKLYIYRRDSVQAKKEENPDQIFQER